MHLLSEVVELVKLLISPILLHRKECNTTNFVKVNENKIDVFFSIPCKFRRYLAREIITDDELKRLANQYHHRHPTFTIDIQERTCKSIILACIYHYRHIEINLRCQCLFDNQFDRFRYDWSTDQIEYQQLLNEIFYRLHSSFIQRSLEDQIETVIDEMTKHFTRLKPVHEEQSTIIVREDKSISPSSPSMEILKYERSPLSRRRQTLERSSSWSQPLTRRSVQNFHHYEKRV